MKRLLLILVLFTLPLSAQVQKLPAGDPDFVGTTATWFDPGTDCDSSDCWLPIDDLCTDDATFIRTKDNPSFGNSIRMAFDDPPSTPGSGTSLIRVRWSAPAGTGSVQIHCQVCENTVITTCGTELLGPGFGTCGEEFLSDAIVETTFNLTTEPSNYDNVHFRLNAQGVGGTSRQARIYCVTLEVPGADASWRGVNKK